VLHVALNVLVVEPATDQSLGVEDGLPRQSRPDERRRTFVGF